MKKYCFCLFLLILLGGCAQSPDEMETAMQLRSKLLQASSCSFEAEIIADYGDKVHTFVMNCIADPGGDLTFTVTEPDSISGITGKLTGEGGKLTFDETALHFELLAEKQLSPISAPWIFMKTLRSGYLTSVCREEEKIRLSIDDSFKENALRLDIWLDSENEPEYAEILYANRKILSVSVDNFEIL